MTSNNADRTGFSVDTTFVLFFLAVDFGQSILLSGWELGISALTLAAVLVLPYFFPSAEEKPDFTGWILGRSMIGGFAVLLGIGFSQSLGTVLPDTFRFLPMTLLILTAMLSCALQLCGIIRFRLAG